MRRALLTPTNMAAKVHLAPAVVVEPAGRNHRERRPVRLVALLALSLQLCLGAGGQAAAEQPAIPSSSKAKANDPLNRDSPQSSVLSFLEACHSHNYTRAAKYLDLRKLSRQRLPKDGPILAEQLGQILERDARFEIAALSREPAGEATDGLPANRERVESFSIEGQTLDLEMERVSLRSRSPIWLFSADSVDRIPSSPA
jgi:MscS family membrane protein